MTSPNRHSRENGSMNTRFIIVARVRCEKNKRRKKKKRALRRRTRIIERALYAGGGDTSTRAWLEFAYAERKYLNISTILGRKIFMRFRKRAERVVFTFSKAQTPLSSLLNFIFSFTTSFRGFSFIARIDCRRQNESLRRTTYYDTRVLLLFKCFSFKFGLRSSPLYE